MLIKSVFIKKFRGFQDVKFTLGDQLTVIAGQNGTQKSTLLGILSQPFTITEEGNPLRREKPLSGGSFKSAFADKFRLSPIHDKRGDHEWTLYMHDGNELTLESITRTEGKKVRFWKKDDKKAGSGYIQLPVIFLSLHRLLPIGEDKTIRESSTFTLTEKEATFYKEWHNKLLLIASEEAQSTTYLEGARKNTVGIQTDYYDWQMNSAGQDNIGKILLAVLSFKRLKETNPIFYRGGILAIDEVDATLFPASQVKLVEALSKFSSAYNIQIIFTTHSLSILERACEMRKPAAHNNVNVIYLKSIDRKIVICENPSYETISDHITLAISDNPAAKKISLFSEDKESRLFLKSLLKGKCKHLNIYDVDFGCSYLIDLATKKVPGFKENESLIVLDGDVSLDSSSMKKIKGLKNFLVLPGKIRPECLLAHYLSSLPEASEVWDQLRKGFSKQRCFSEYKATDLRDRVTAKKWFKSLNTQWNIRPNVTFFPWVEGNPAEVEAFITQFDAALFRMPGTHR